MDIDVTMFFLIFPITVPQTGPPNFGRGQGQCACEDCQLPGGSDDGDCRSPKKDLDLKILKVISYLVVRRERFGAIGVSIFPLYFPFNGEPVGAT